MSKSKTPPPGPEHSQEREWRVVLEDIQSEFRVFGEGLTGLQDQVSEISEKLEKVDERLQRVEGDVAVIKVIVPTLATKEDLKKLEKRLTAVETR